MQLKNRVKELRKIKRLSQQNLADEVGILRTTLSKIENGHIRPGTTLMMKFEGVLGEPFGEIFFTSHVSLDDTSSKNKSA